MEFETSTSGYGTVLFHQKCNHFVLFFFPGSEIAVLDQNEERVIVDPNEKVK